MPAGRNSDAALHRDTVTFGHTFVKPNKGKNLVSCKSAILLILPSGMMPSLCIYYTVDYFVAIFSKKLVHNSRVNSYELIILSFILFCIFKCLSLYMLRL
jgi:hypothetical protein